MGECMSCFHLYFTVSGALSVRNVVRRVRCCASLFLKSSATHTRVAVFL